MTAALALLIIGGILFEAARKRQSVIDVMLGREPPPKSIPQPASATTPPAPGATAGVKGRAKLTTIAALAKTMGLTVSEHPDFGGVHPVHAAHSLHYKGRAIDVGGPISRMPAFANTVDRLYGPGLAELFWNGDRAVNRKNGKRVPKGFVSDHTDHVHVAV